MSTSATAAHLSAAQALLDDAAACAAMDKPGLASGYLQQAMDLLAKAHEDLLTKARGKAA